MCYGFFLNVMNVQKRVFSNQEDKNSQFNARNYCNEGCPVVQYL